MAELLARLQDALGDAYRLERELGGGGMSRVFLAEERALGRKVVVKVLPPELGAGLNIDRFRREIQLAANLQHPHIVPLLAAGQADGLLYYTMPLVEGESLRARLVREHELPVGEAIRLLRDVVDALTCAHEHGVVHRDIKPDNVLVSRHHGLVTDFGVAKALSESTGRSALTSVGVALGTPAYMAPEQASADPNADHRVDIYAVGALAYEMLTGRPPFTGNSPQAILAAQVTQAPAPITESRATVPPALAGLVMRCLEKKPADRWQTAEELLHQFEAMATPSGGTQPVLTPVGAQPSATVASGASSPGRPKRWWLRPALIAAGAVILVLGGVYLGGAKGRAPAAVAETDAKMLAVLPFKNLGASEDQYFADGLTEEITSRLATVQGLGVISRTSADQYRNTPKALREIGRELGAGYVLEGSVRWEKRTGAPSRVRVTPQLIRVSDDRHLWADRYDAELADIFTVQGNIAEKVMAALNVALGDSGRAAMADRPTAVPEAYDFYLRGLEYENLRDRGEEQQLALQFFQKAALLDPRFALALARISKIHTFNYWSYRDRTDTRLALAKATADSALRLSPDLPEGHVALGFYHY
ncbi:MAG: protein kinase domain-containing protein, partial [Gemmatimonadales bacterium]